MLLKKLFLTIILMGGVATRVGAQSDLEKVYALNFQDATRLALENNFDIQLAKYDAWIARTDLGVSQSVYDAIVNASLSYRKNKEARTTTILGTEVQDNDYTIGVSKKFASGTTINLEQDNNRNASDATFATNSVTHNSYVKLEVVQELGRNFFGLKDRGDVKITQLDIEGVEHTTLLNIEQYLAQVQKAYWKLVEAYEILKIEEGMLVQAQKLYDLHTEQLKDGLVEAPEVIASEANLKERQNSQILAENAYKAHVNHLKLLINIDDASTQIVPVDNFQFPQTRSLLDVSLDIAFDHRRDYKRQLLKIKSDRVQLSIDKNNLWPEINVTASLRRNGLGGGFDNAVSNIFEEDNPDIYAGISVEFPLQNRKAESKKEKAELEAAKSVLRLKYIERQIITEISNKVRDCEVLKNVAHNAQLVAQLYEKKLEEEQKRFNLGRSETDTIIRFQEDLLRARRQSLIAQNNYQNSIIDLKVTEGSLLDQYWQGEL